ncbi:MAG: HPr kinase/phosphatase C-terminal domain-containing protein [Bradyrhizobiaceae bacterium]|nr:HPr kinase/phosphatase C-terminal domain-containing protein [Bradyrhizobiaceae bacterium]
MSSSIHASAVLVGARAVLIRGPSGSGKSRLAFDLIAAAGGPVRFARLVADDRAEVAAAAGRLLVRPASSLAGLIEVRGLGIRRLAYEPIAVVGFVVDLAATDAQRLPEPEQTRAVIEGIALVRLAIALEEAALPRVIAALHLPESAV